MFSIKRVKPNSAFVIWVFIQISLNGAIFDTADYSVLFGI